MKKIDFYLIRHAETEWNLMNKMQGSKNSALTKKGILEAEITGQFLSSTPFIAAYSSPQKRAIETCDHILRQQLLSMPVAPLAEHGGLCEMDFGLWEACSINQLRRDPAFQNYLYSPAKFDPAINQGEHFLDVISRMQKALQDIAQQHTGGNILVVTHGAALRLLLHVIKGESWLSCRNENLSPHIVNTSISLVCYQQACSGSPGKFTVKKYNDTSHLL